MTSCEKCWAEAVRRNHSSGQPASEIYDEVLAEHKANPCTPKEQAGQWWSDEWGVDTRVYFRCERCEGTGTVPDPKYPAVRIECPDCEGEQCLDRRGYAPSYSDHDEQNG